MPVFMKHDQVRVFAQLLRELTGRDVKHSQILRQIAAAKCVAYDALMHRLKNRETERVELSLTDLQSVAALLSTLSNQPIALPQVENAAYLAAGKIPASPATDTKWVTFKNNFKGKVTLSPSMLAHQGRFPDEDFGFGPENLVDADLIAPSIADFKTRTSEVELEISSPFTLNLLVVPSESNRLKSSGFQAVDDLVDALTVTFAPTGRRYIVNGETFRPSSVKRTPILTSDLREAIEKLQPTHNTGSSAEATGHPHGTFESKHADPSYALSLLRHTWNRLLALQNIPTAYWRMEIDSIETIARGLQFHGRNGPLYDYRHLLASLFEALKTIVTIHGLAAAAVDHERWDDVRSLIPLIENLISIDKRKDRTGDTARRQQLAKDLNSSMRHVYILGHITNKPGEKQFDWRSIWVDAIRELMGNPLWTVADDIAIYLSKTPMTAYNGYRLSSWTPD